jgi:hypothetical protein
MLALAMHCTCWRCCPSCFFYIVWQKVAETTIQALRWLGARDHTFIYWDDASRTYQPTPFGKAVLASGLPPEVCLILKVGWLLAVVALCCG